MINLKQEIQNYSSINLKSLAEDENQIPDNIKNSILLYNKAIESIKIDSEDIAIIELKKAISMNPNFYEAMNLLGVCYSHIKEYMKAAEIFEKVIAAENNSIKALKYLGQLNSSEVYLKGSEKRSKGAINEGVHSEKVKKSLSLLDDVVNIRSNWKVDFKKYLFGFLICTVIVLIIYFINYEPKDSYVMNSTPKPSTAQMSTLEETTTDQDGTGTPDEVIKLQNELKEVMNQLDYYKNSMKLYEVEALYGERKYEEAADILVLVKTVPFTGEAKERFDILEEKVMVKAANRLKEEAWTLFKNKRFQDSLDKIAKIQLYGNTWPYMDFCYYCSGRCYVGLNDSKKAVESFQQIINSYPNSRYLKYAENKIKEIISNP